MSSKQLNVEALGQYVVRVLTPYYHGIGFYLSSHQLIITAEHLVRNQKSVVVIGSSIGRKLASVIFVDPTNDVAILSAPNIPEDMCSLRWNDSDQLCGEQVIAVSCLPDLELIQAKGEIVSENRVDDEHWYLNHSAKLLPRHSGSLLIDEAMRVIGVNQFVSGQNNRGNCLRLTGLRSVLDDIRESQVSDTHFRWRCSSCAQVVGVEQDPVERCPLCHTELRSSGESVEENHVGIPGLIEEIISDLGYEVRLAREGNQHWNVQRGSAFVNLSYHRDSGFIDGDAYLCKLPDNEHNVRELYDFLMRENYQTEGLVFSLKEDCILLSLRIYDRHLEKDTGRILIRNLFDKADYYDNVLVDRFQAVWIE